jgi:hypothetical protein
MRHSDFRGMEKNAQAYDEEYEGSTARSVDEHYNVPFSPNSSSEFLTDGPSRQQHSLFSFVAKKEPKKKNKKPKGSATTTTLTEQEDLATIEERPQMQTRGRLPSREYADTQFEMEPDEDSHRFNNAGTVSSL